MSIGTFSVPATDLSDWLHIRPDDGRRHADGPRMMSRKLQTALIALAAAACMQHAEAEAPWDLFDNDAAMGEEWETGLKSGMYMYV